MREFFNYRCPDDAPLELIVDGVLTCVTELECLATTCKSKFLMI